MMVLQIVWSAIRRRLHDDNTVILGAFGMRRALHVVVVMTVMPAAVCIDGRRTVIKPVG